MCAQSGWLWTRLRPSKYHPLAKVSRFTLYYVSLTFCHGRQHNNTHPITKEPLAPSDLITLHYSRKEASGELHDPISFKPFSEHSHIVAIATTGNVFLAESIKGGKDLVSDVPYKKYVFLYTNN